MYRNSDLGLEMDAKPRVQFESEGEVDDELGVVVLRPKVMRWHPKVEKVMAIIDK
jgi:hypothetical protein